MEERRGERGQEGKRYMMYRDTRRRRREKEWTEDEQVRCKEKRTVSQPRRVSDMINDSGLTEGREEDRSGEGKKERN